eukprot:gnl/TRDRNA2_/TRDRNA2_90600_c0_seq1.p1 gnl/TRDRNA2_/TRDRNA2_90600_c0~~gnl/TRDRNA2_/TRDRNA2_90600_c0_seq1.p1  ORF type:complete len:373 (+),score=7.34 gnl/TRDRNA2_/TRDRNA2_90600_c0_seq1:33-1151(+)
MTMSYCSSSPSLLWCLGLFLPVLLGMYSCPSGSSCSEWKSWQAREYHIIAFRKTGTVLCIDAENILSGLLDNVAGLASDFKPPLVVCSYNTMAYAIESSMMLTPKPSSFVYLARNPFEMVVSGYLYAIGGGDGEDRLPFEQGQFHVENFCNACKPSFTNSRMGIFCNGSDFQGPETPISWSHKYAVCQLLSGMVSAFKASLLDTWSGPHAHAHETRSEYLNRVPLDAGLISEFLFFSHSVFPPMRFTKDFLKSGRKANTHTQAHTTYICFHEFYENCTDVWQRVMRAWQVPKRLYSHMVHAAEYACPHKSSSVLGHSTSSELMKSKNITLPKYEILSRLRELDRIFLNGTIAALEDYLDCPVSRSYKEFQFA